MTRYRIRLGLRREAAAEAVCATHDDLIRRDGSRVQCACSPHARWRELAGR